MNLTTTGEMPQTSDKRFGTFSTAMEVVEGVDLSAKTAIVTGGASGIGLETARALAHAGAAVTLAVRDLRAGEAAATELNEDGSAVPVRVEVLDLADLGSVRAFAARWQNRPLSILVNNAGVMACPLSKTKDGFEMQLGTNHLGHFLLTTLLVPALEAGQPSRVVVLASSAHMASAIDFDDPFYERRDYEPFAAYGQSKTANMLFALEFDRRYRDRGIRSFSVMPGVIHETRLERHMDPKVLAKIRESGPPIDHLVKTMEQGAATSVWAATVPEASDLGGRYLENCGLAPPFHRGLPRGIGVMDHASDEAAAQRLWVLSEEWVG